MAFSKATSSPELYFVQIRSAVEHGLNPVSATDFVSELLEDFEAAFRGAAIDETPEAVLAKIERMVLVEAYRVGRSMVDRSDLLAGIWKQIREYRLSRLTFLAYGTGASSLVIN